MIGSVKANPEDTGTEVDAGNEAERQGQTLAARIRARFVPLGGVDLAQEPREPVRPAPDLEPGS